MISELFAIIFLVSILGLIIGIVKPSVFEVYMKPVPAKKNLILSFLVLLIFSSYMMVKFSPTEKKEQTPDQQNNQAVSQPVDETKKGEDVKTSAPAASSKADAVQTSAPQSAEPKPAVQQSEPPKEKSYQQIFSFSGNGAKSSEPFTITGSRFKIKYDCSGTFCQAFLYKNGTMDDLIMNASGPIKDETIIYGPGEYYINANTSGSFVMTVEDYK